MTSGEKFICREEGPAIATVICGHVNRQQPNRSTLSNGQHKVEAGAFMLQELNAPYIRLAS
jgi:hypothetical protein